MQSKFYLSLILGFSSIQLIAASTQTVSDNPLYIDFCQKAFKNEQVFENFKRNPIYNICGEFHTQEEGKQMVGYITSHFPELLEKIDLFKKNDQVGNPRLYDYEALGRISPTTLRYVQIAGELKQRFGDLSNMRVVEIGGGYGGLCTVLSQLYPLKSYTLIDIPSSLQLAKKYLEKQGVHNVQFIAIDQLKDRLDCDLVISHYGFSESDRSVQKKHIAKVLTASDKGFLICNVVPRHFRVNAFTQEELKEKLSALKIPFQIAQEEPLLGKDHFLISWDKKTTIK